MTTQLLFPSVATPVPARLLEQYEDYLTGSRGRSPWTVRSYLSDLRTFNAFLEGSNADYTRIDRRFVNRYAAWLTTTRRYSRATIIRKLVSLRAFYRFMQDEGYARTNPVPASVATSMSAEKKLPHFLSEEEMYALLHSPDTSTPTGLRDFTILQTLYATGMRVSEICGLDLVDVDLKQAQARVWGKGSKERFVQLFEDNVLTIKRYIDEARLPQCVAVDGDALFLSSNGRRMSTRTVQRIVKTHVDRSGVDPKTHVHSIRHSFATHLIEGGANLRVVQELMGHASLATTQIYTHVTQRYTRRVYESAHPMANGQSQTKEE